MVRIAGVMLAAALAGSGAGASAEQGFTVAGFYKNLLIDSHTASPEGRGYVFDLSTLRLEINAELSERVTIEIQYDNQILLGNYLSTAQFARQDANRPRQYWRLERDYATGRNLRARHSLYRATLHLAGDDTDLRIGRQRIAWGTGRLWSPLDILNPISPIQLEREERIGVDAVLLERRFDALSRLSAVYAPAADGGEASAALRWHANRAGVDYSLVAGRFLGELVLGADVATQLGGAGLRAELTAVWPNQGSSYQRALLGVDYAFANTLILSGELYHDGAGAAASGGPDPAAPPSGNERGAARTYLGGVASYQISPLLKWTNVLVVNLGDRSRYFSTNFVYSLRANLDLTVGAQLFGGARGGEYAALRDLWYMQLQWYF